MHVFSFHSFMALYIALSVGPLIPSAFKNLFSGKSKVKKSVSFNALMTNLHASLLRI